MAKHHYRHDLPDRQVNNAMHRLLFGYKVYPKDKSADQARGQSSTHLFEVNAADSAKHFSAVCNTAQPTANLYPKAYKRWEKIWSDAQDKEAASLRQLTFTHRAIINLAQPSLWESSTSFNPTYGTPVIPGSACKGLARHFATTHLDITSDHIDALFESQDHRRKVQFMDAWWIPNSAPGRHTDRPWVREIVTPHHPEFMKDKGKTPATPFDSPVPSPQIATHGSFLFVVQGPKLWADYALNILQLALETEGIGARTPEYGCIKAPDNKGKP